jgi:hypothetical protein
MRNMRRPGACAAITTAAVPVGRAPTIMMVVAMAVTVTAVARTRARACQWLR